MGAKAGAARAAVVGLRRLIAELRAVPTARDADAALARLRVRFEPMSHGESAGPGAIIDEGERDQRGLDTLGAGSVVAVRIERDVYASVPTAKGRVRLLTLAARAVKPSGEGARPSTIDVHVVVKDEDSHVGRLAIDAPRRVLHAIGARVAEPGDRLGPWRYVHCFFDEEALLTEIHEAGLALVARKGFVFSLRGADRDEHRDDARAPTAEIAEPFATELARVVRIVRDVDARRLHDTPEHALDDLRARGTRAKERGPIGRARLRRAIGWVDAVLPGGANCYRRILLEVALDAGAARETVVFGLDVGSTGHVAFADREDRTFDVAFAIPARSGALRSGSP